MSGEGVGWGTVPKKLDNLKAEYGMQRCGLSPTPPTKDWGPKVCEGQSLHLERTRSAGRRIAILNYIAQDRPDLSVSLRVLSQQMSCPVEGTEVGVKRAVRDFQEHPKVVGCGAPGMTRVWTDSDLSW